MIFSKLPLLSTNLIFSFLPSSHINFWIILLISVSIFQTSWKPDCCPDLLFSHLDFMQLFSTDYFFAPENMKKPSSKVGHNRPHFFQYCLLAQNQPKYHFLFHKNVSLRDIYIMTLNRAVVYASLWPIWLLFVCQIFRNWNLNSKTSKDLTFKLLFLKQNFKRDWMGSFVWMDSR